MKQKPETLIALCLVSLSALPMSAIAEPLTLQIRGATMSNIVKELSSKTGDLYEVLPQLENEVLAISCVSKEPEEIRAQIASVLRGTWKKTEKGYRLVADEQAWRELRKKQLDADTASVSWMLQGYVKASKASQTTQGSTRTGESRGKPLTSEAVMDRTALQCATLIEPRLLASMPSRSRRVFSLAPTKIQFPLATSARQILKGAFDELAAIQRGAAHVGPIKRVPTLDEVSSVVLSTIRKGAALEFEVTLTVCDANDGVLLNGEVFIDRASLLPNQTPEENSETSDFKDATFSADARAAKEVFLQKRGEEPLNVFGLSVTAGEGGKGTTITVDPLPLLYGPPPRVAISNALRAKLDHPEVYDPLSYHASEAIFIANGKNGGDFIALLPDFLAQRLLASVSEKTSRDSVLDELRKLGMVESKQTGWIVWQPERIVDSIDMRLDRKALRAELANLEASGIWSLASKSAYFAHRPRALTGGIDTALIRALYPAGSSLSIPDGPDRDLMRLWGMLSATQRRSLVEQGGLRVNSLSPLQLSALGNMVFDHAYGPSLTTTLKTGVSIAANWGSAERTTALPTGVPLDAILQLTVETEPGALGRYANNEVRPLSATKVFQIQNLLEQGAAPRVGDDKANIVDYANADFLNLLFKLKISPDFGMDGGLHDIKVDSKPTFGPFSKLSQALFARVREVQKNMARAAGGPPSAPARGPGSGG